MMWCNVLLVFCCTLLCQADYGDDFDIYDTLETFDHSHSYQSKLITFFSLVDTSEELQDEWNDRVEAADYEPPLPLFQCNTTGDFPRAETIHELRPWDIDVVAAMGDSITAGNGLGAQTLLEVALENRGESWSIGGDYSYEEGVVTLANILREYNPDLMGQSVCVSQETEESKSWLNLAEPGGDSGDMPEQAQFIVDRCVRDERIDVDDDWKMVTLFIGGNDFCGSCDEDYEDWIDPDHTPETFGDKIEEAVDIFAAQLPRTFVNLVPMFDITPLNLFNDTLCNVSHWLFCDCVIRNESKMEPLQKAYYQEMVNLVESGKYSNRSDFTVVIQPMFVESTLPMNNETGLPERDFLSPDCFHPGRGAHQSFAWSLWNTMFYPVGQKPMNVMDLVQTEWTCPSDELPYFATEVNSLPPN